VVASPLPENVITEVPGESGTGHGIACSGPCIGVIGSAGWPLIVRFLSGPVHKGDVDTANNPASTTARQADDIDPDHGEHRWVRNLWLSTVQILCFPRKPRWTGAVGPKGAAQRRLLRRSQLTRIHYSLRFRRRFFNGSP
jgi:hypothetical protein